MQYRTRKMMSALLCEVVAGGFSAAVMPPVSAQTTPAKSTPAKSTPAVAKSALEIAANAVVATVNGEKILMSSISLVLDKINERVTISQANLDKMRVEIVEDLIIERLMVQQAKTLKLEPPQQKIDDAIWNLQKPFSSRQAFLDALAKQGKTEADLRTVIAEDMMITAFSKTVTKDIVVSDDEVGTYYKTHPDEFLVPEMVHVRHIQVSFPASFDKDGKLVMKNLTDAEQKAMTQKAQALLKKATASNADFAALAKTSSEDKVSKPAGGDLGFLARDDVMDKAFGDVVFTAPVGKVYPKLVQTKFGYNILKIEEKKPSRTLPLTEVAPYIKPRLLQNKFKARMEIRVAELRKAATITNMFPKTAA